MRRLTALLFAVALAACSSPPSSPPATVAGSSAIPSARATEATGSVGPSSEATTHPTPAPTPTHTPTTTPTPTPTLTPTPTPAGPTLAQRVGQKLMVAMDGTTIPSADLLGRIRRGEVGGVILFGRNITTEAALIALTKKLQGAATAGGQPRLLISTDQEGGSIKRIPWAPPTLSPPQMGASGSTSTATAQGRATGAALLKDGVNLDLAPVADVPASTSSFMYQQGRTWSFSAATTTSVADAFAQGMAAAGELATMKHFPGLGYAVRNTDAFVVKLTQSRAQLDPGLDPYRGAIGQGIPVIMLSNAWYAAWDTANAAGWSRAIGTTLLRDQLGFRGVTITDSLSGIAAAMGVSARSLAIKAAAAGTDIILVTGSEASTKATFSALLASAQAGTIARSDLDAGYARILSLKAALGAP
jgi:beta-N-acetylhexosaminidase